MRRMKLGMAAVAVLLAGTLTACGDAGEDDDDAPEVAAEEDCDDKFEDGTRMAELADAGEIDDRQPGTTSRDSAARAAPDSVPRASTSTWRSC